MSAIRTIVSFRRLVCRGGGLLLLVLFLVLVVFALSPELHRAVHADADTPGHHCAVSALLHGQIEPPVGDPPLGLAEFGGDYATPLVLGVVPETEELLPPGRGPPQVLS